MQTITMHNTTRHFQNQTSQRLKHKQFTTANQTHKKLHEHTHQQQEQTAHQQHKNKTITHKPIQTQQTIQNTT